MSVIIDVGSVSYVKKIHEFSLRKKYFYKAH